MTNRSAVGCLQAALETYIAAHFAAHVGEALDPREDTQRWASAEASVLTAEFFREIEGSADYLWADALVDHKARSIRVVSGDIREPPDLAVDLTAGTITVSRGSSVEVLSSYVDSTGKTRWERRRPANGAMRRAVYWLTDRLLTEAWERAQAEAKRKS